MQGDEDEGGESAEGAALGWLAGEDAELTPVAAEMVAEEMGLKEDNRMCTTKATGSGVFLILSQAPIVSSKVVKLISICFTARKGCRPSRHIERTFTPRSHRSSSQIAARQPPVVVVPASRPAATIPCFPTKPHYHRRHLLLPQNSCFCV